MAATLINQASNIAASILGYKSLPSATIHFNTLTNDAKLKLSIIISPGNKLEFDKLINLCKGESFNSIQSKILRSFKSQARDLFYSDASFEIQYELIHQDQFNKPKADKKRKSEQKE